MRKKDLSVILLIIIAASMAVVGFFIFKGNESRIVMMDDKGFSPSTVEIKKGSVVTFVNKGKNPLWPASNIHPTHQIYPEFDPRRPVVAGDLWSFTFDKAGNWRFHDHLNPEMKGVIIVQ